MSKVLNQLKEGIQKQKDEKHRLAKIMDMGWSEYFSLPYFSASKIKSYESNPALYHFGALKGAHLSEVQHSKAKSFGSVIHKFLLETEEFNKNVDAYMEVLSPSYKKIFYSVADSIRKNKTIMNMLGDIKFKEKVLIFEALKINKDGKELKVLGKARVDLFTNSGWLLDFKSIASLGTRRTGRMLIMRAVNDYRYDLQVAYYQHALKYHGEKVKGTIIIFMEKAPPYEVVPFYLGPNMMERGENGNIDFNGWKPLLEEMFLKPRKSRFDDINELEIEN